MGEDDRLALLPVERVLSGGDGRYTREQVAERAGLDPDVLRRQWRALGFAIPADDVASFADRDVEVAKRGAIHDALEGSFAWSYAGSKKLRGIGEVRLFRCRVQ